ncbi:MAG: hypothetical protein ACYSU2_00375 [Planctomycetota bacterium]|jgi:hypothetical protein
MTPAGRIICLAFAAIPPLTDSERARLDGAVDGRDQRGEAFAALVENISRWSPGAGETPVRLDPDLEQLLTEPAAHRGQLFRVAGGLEQQTPLAYPYEDVSEWVVRDRSGRLALVFVCGLDPDHGFQPDRPVEILARFYKRVDAVARDGRLHRYPAFVGAFPESGAGGAGWGRLWTVTVPVAVMLVVFLLLLLYARRGQGPMRGRVGATGPWTTEQGDEHLPDDPAEALAELRRRAETDE